ncbi:unnamed protein product [Rhizophagus irregularis]|nr:unnamed protein product [Rhizophagus irregularis]
MYTKLFLFGKLQKWYKCFDLGLQNESIHLVPFGFFLYWILVTQLPSIGFDLGLGKQVVSKFNLAKLLFY